MPTTSTRQGAQRRLTTGAAAICLGLTAYSAPVATAAGTTGPDRLATSTAELAPSTDVSVPTRPAARRSEALARTEPRTTSGTRAKVQSLTAARTQATTQAVTCSALGFQANQLRDRTWLIWQAPAGATGNATVTRQREGSTTWQTVGSVPAVTGALLDTHQSPAGPAAYRISMTVSGEVWSCDMTDSSGATVTGLSMFPDAGPGVPDFAVSTTGSRSLQMQNDMSLANPVNPAYAPANTATPAFSPDGQYIAFARFSSDSASDLVVQRADGRGAPVTVGASTASATATINAEPSYSPNGRYLAWTRYSYNASTASMTPVGIQIRDMYAGTTRSLAAPYATPVWTRDGLSLVVADLASASGGLRRVTVASGAVSGILSGTAGGYDPTITRSGQIVYANVTSANVSSLRIRSSAADTATVTVRYTAPAGSSVSNPRLAPQDGTTYFRMDTDPDGVPNSNDEYTGIYRLAPGSQTAEITSLGATAADSTTVGTSFDIRQSAAPGTSDLNGDVANDLIAKDSSGYLWLYPNSKIEGAPIKTRTLISTGWNMYTLVMAAGDLNADGRGDIIARDSGGGMWFYPGLGNGKVGARIYAGGGWNGFVPLAVGDYDHDTHADLLGRDGAGAMWLYRGQGKANATGAFFYPRIGIGSGWLSFNALTAVGDANYDNEPDILTRTTSNGVLKLYGGPGAATYPKAGVTMKTTGTTNFNSISRFVGPERYSSYATSLELIDKGGTMWDAVFTGDGDLSWPYSQTKVAGGALAYNWTS